MEVISKDLFLISVRNYSYLLNREEFHSAMIDSNEIGEPTLEIYVKAKFLFIPYKKRLCSITSQMNDSYLHECYKKLCMWYYEPKESK